MKILLASDVYKYSMNGAAGVVINLADELRSLGHDVKVLTMSDSKDGFQKGDDYYLPSYATPAYPDLRQSLVRRHPYIEEIKEWRPEVIHLHTEGSAARIARSIAKAVGAPIVMTMHTDYAKFAFHEYSEIALVKGLCTVLTAFFYHGAAAMTTPSKKAEELLKSYKYKNPVYVIPNGLKLERFQKDYLEGERAALFDHLHIPDNKKTFVCVSRLSAEKNIEELLDCFALLVQKEPDAHLLLVGDGPDMNNLVKRSEKNGLTKNVLFTGRMPQDELYRYYKAGIAFLSASTFEMNSLTYLEALACGLPLICRDDPCLEGVLDDGKNGFAYRTPEDFVEKCELLINDPDMQAEFARVSLERSEEYSDRNCALRMLKLYEFVTEKDPAKKDTWEKDAAENDTAPNDAAENDAAQNDAAENDTAQKGSAEKETAKNGTAQNDTE